jgi:hypothetical protein
MLASAAWVAVISTCVYAYRRLRHRRRRWSDALLSTSTLCISLAFLFFGSLGIAIQWSDRCDLNDNGAEAAPAPASTDLSGAQQSVVEYLNGTISCASRVHQGRETAKRFLAAIERSKAAQAHQHATKARQDSERFATCLDRIVPVDDPLLAAHAIRSVRSVREVADGWKDYQQGSREPFDLASLDRGDRQIATAQRHSRRATAAIERIYRARGGSDQLGAYIDFNRLRAVRKRAGIE